MSLTTKDSHLHGVSEQGYGRKRICRRKVIKMAWVIFCVILFLGCSTVPEPVCRHWALFSAITYQDLVGVDVRIGGGVSGTKADVGHSQAEALIDGKWVPIAYFYGKIRIVEKDDYHVFRYYTIDEFKESVFDK